MQQLVAALALLLLPLIQAKDKSIVRNEHLGETVHVHTDGKVNKLLDESEEDLAEGEEGEDVEDLREHALLHQTDAGSPVDGVLIMSNGKAFDHDEVKKVCDSLAGHVDCLHDLPMTVVRTPSEKLAQLLQRLPIKFLSLQDSGPAAARYLTEHMGENAALDFLSAFNDAGVKIPEDMLLELNDGKSEMDMDSGNDAASPGDGFKEKDPKTGKSDFNHKYLLHQDSDGSAVDGVLFVKNEAKFTTEAVRGTCKKESDDIKCIIRKDLPIIVVRATRDHLENALSHVGEVEYKEFTEKGVKEKVVEYLKTHVHLKELQPLIDKYAEVGVDFPIEMFEEEFEKEGEALDP